MSTLQRMQGGSGTIQGIHPLRESTSLSGAQCLLFLPTVDVQVRSDPQPTKLNFSESCNPDIAWLRCV